MTAAGKTNEEIRKRTDELRLLHTSCTGRQKLAIIKERIDEGQSLNNSVALYFSRIEALGRFILIKSDNETDHTRKYNKYKSCSVDTIIKKVRNDYPDYFCEDVVCDSLESLDALKSARNYLVHEFAYLNGTMASKLLHDAELIYDVLERIVRAYFWTR